MNSESSFQDIVSTAPIIIDAAKTSESTLKASWPPTGDGSVVRMALAGSVIKFNRGASAGGPFLAAIAPDAIAADGAVTFNPVVHGSTRENANSTILGFAKGVLSQMDANGSIVAGGPLLMFAGYAVHVTLSRTAGHFHIAFPPDAASMTGDYPVDEATLALIGRPIQPWTRDDTPPPPHSDAGAVELGGIIDTHPTGAAARTAAFAMQLPLPPPKASGLGTAAEVMNLAGLLAAVIGRSTDAPVLCRVMSASARGMSTGSPQGVAPYGIDIVSRTAGLVHRAIEWLGACNMENIASRAAVAITPAAGAVLTTQMRIGLLAARLKEFSTASGRSGSHPPPPQPLQPPPRQPPQQPQQQPFVPQQPHQQQQQMQPQQLTHQQQQPSFSAAAAPPLMSAEVAAFLAAHGMAPPRTSANARVETTPLQAPPGAPGRGPLSPDGVASFFTTAAVAAAQTTDALFSSLGESASLQMLAPYRVPPRTRQVLPLEGPLMLVDDLLSLAARLDGFPGSSRSSSAWDDISGPWRVMGAPATDAQAQSRVGQMTDAVAACIRAAEAPSTRAPVAAKDMPFGAVGEPKQASKTEEQYAAASTCWPLGYDMTSAIMAEHELTSRRAASGMKPQPLEEIARLVDVAQGVGPPAGRHVLSNGSVTGTLACIPASILPARHAAHISMLTAARNEVSMVRAKDAAIDSKITGTVNALFYGDFTPEKSRHVLHEAVELYGGFAPTMDEIQIANSLGEVGTWGDLSSGDSCARALIFYESLMHGLYSAVGMRDARAEMFGVRGNRTLPRDTPVRLGLSYAFATLLGRNVMIPNAFAIIETALMTFTMDMHTWRREATESLPQIATFLERAADTEFSRAAAEQMRFQQMWANAREAERGAAATAASTRAPAPAADPNAPSPAPASPAKKGKRQREADKAAKAAAARSDPAASTVAAAAPPAAAPAATMTPATAAAPAAAAPTTTRVTFAPAIVTATSRSPPPAGPQSSKEQQWMADFTAGNMIDQHQRAYYIVEALFKEAHSGEAVNCGRRALRGDNSACPLEADYVTQPDGQLRKPAGKPSAPIRPCSKCPSVPFRKDLEEPIATRVRARCEARLVSDFKEKG